MAFTTPPALLLLLTLPYLSWLGRPRTAYRRRREWLGRGLRLLLALLLILALSGFQLVSRPDELAVVFLVDYSDSMGEAGRQAALAFVEEAVAQLGANDRAAVVVFGADALVERPLSAARKLAPVHSAPLTLNTDLAGAIRLGMALFPPGCARRLIILSDGLATVGDAEEAARLAALSGIQIDYAPFNTGVASEVMLAEVAAPTRLEQGQEFELGLPVSSQAEPQARLRIIAAGRVTHEEIVSLHVGNNYFSLPMIAGAPGFTDFRVELEPIGPGDVFYQTNVLRASTDDAAPPRVQEGLGQFPEFRLQSGELVAGDVEGLPVEHPGLRVLGGQPLLERFI